ncbi:NADPH-cytochrome P450 reductase-like protein [Rhizodiscina lignyota]|uniref:Bifunctional cytochrome P450/NADPH--P450 reductase n=1 Tax=Rhizodiscina lignyota TaxID=1504668 RepID=A0A9P4M7T4_9PEZI|nr:NADPH-cytochrome P450 reductase-like protein [Rhizodiscina lignyota]
MTEPIPGPRGYPIIGNLLDVQAEVPLHALERLADIYGPLFKFKVGSHERVATGSFEIFDELCDETRFWKVPPRALQSSDGQRRAVGLFASPSEKNEDWGQAHRILMPAFGPIAIESMFNEMHDIASQLILKWARKGSDYKIPVSGDMSRLTLDTIALCAMDFRFNSFYQDELHPFVQAMNNVLANRSNAVQLSGIISRLLPSHTEQLKKDSLYQKKVSQDLVQYRRDHPTDKKDLLNAMIYGKDPRSGQTMRDELIAANMQTFLVAGHETTSGLLSFAFLLMLKNPSTYFAAQQEVDRVIGKGKVEVKHLNQLKYINALLRETLRLTPTAPAITRSVRPENKEEIPTVGGGKWAVPRDGAVICLLGKIQRDPKVWGDDAEEFKPERMIDEKFEKIPKNAWKPFGTGLRACIGRAFAWQEAVLAVALILQNFDLSLDDPKYEFKVVQTLTIKPKDFFMRAKLRPGIVATQLQESLMASAPTDLSPHEHASKPGTQDPHAGKIRILYGSNTGTCQSLAQKLASQAKSAGSEASVEDMDSMIGSLPKDQPVVIITASYEGQPPDNAARFVAWLESLEDKKAFEGTKFAVFGCGHSDWRTTFLRIPQLVDSKLAELGASRITAMGSTDVSKNNIFDDFETWAEKELWPVMPAVSGSQPVSMTESVKLPDLIVETTAQRRAAHLKQDLQYGTVVDVKRLTASTQREKRHIEIELPEGMTYQVGDYLAVLPLNPDDSVKRVMKRLGLPADGVLTIRDAGPTILPTEAPIMLFGVLKGYVELSQPATPRDVAQLVDLAVDPDERGKLKDLTDPDIYTTSILNHRTSVIDLLERCPSIQISLAQLLTMLPPLRPRHYSISSSSLNKASSCTLTYSVIDEPAMSNSDEHFEGITSTYLRDLKPGDRILVSVRSTNKQFRLPTDPEKTPIMMVAAGSGIAPFRGFIEERAVLIKEGNRKLAKALLFFGCRSPTADCMYRDEFDEWVKIGAVDVRYCFSQDPARSEGCKYVQDRMLKDRQDIYDLWDGDAKFFVCGTKNVAHEVARVARELVKGKAEAEGNKVSDEEVDEWIKEKRGERFVSDVFS